MKKQAYEMDANGLINEIHVVDVDEKGNILNEGKENFVSVYPPNGLYRAKWNGAEWIEDMSQEEINEITKSQPSPPTDKERIAMLEDTINYLLGL